MPGRIALERFGSPLPDDDGALDTGDMPVTEHESAPRAGTLESDLDPEIERTACLGRIANALEIAASEQASLRARCIEDTVIAFGKVAETVLPKLARAGFAALIAETALTIARLGQWPELQVIVAPDDAEAVTGALASHDPHPVSGPIYGPVPGPAPGPRPDPRPDPGLTITTDPALGPGEAHLGWSQGGAEIDVDAITETALERFRLQLDGYLQQGTC